MRRFLIILAFALLFVQCKEKNSSKMPVQDEKGTTAALFTLMDASKTKLNFINLINESPTVNGIVYEYLYNGGGVAVGDLNNDDLPDIYFISNLYSNKLFINKGNLLLKKQHYSQKLKATRVFPQECLW